MTPLERLTAVLADSRRYDDPFVKPSTDDLALVLAVAKAARAWAKARERWLFGEGDDNGFLLDETVLALLAAIAAIEGSKE